MYMLVIYVDECSRLVKLSRSKLKISNSGPNENGMPVKCINSASVDIIKSNCF